MTTRDDGGTGRVALRWRHEPALTAPGGDPPEVPPTDAPPRVVVDEQALIEEARRRQRRRWWRVAIGCVVVALVGALVYVVGSGGGGVDSTRNSSRPSAGSTAPPRARWHALTAESLPTGSTVDSITRYEGALYAAGTYFSAKRPAGYPSCSEPFVWSSADGGPWDPFWCSTSPTGVTFGSGARQYLVATPVGLFLFAAGTSGSAMWRLTDGSGFERVALPSLVDGISIAGASWGNGRLVVIEANKFSRVPHSVYGDADAVWTSTNGVSWKRDRLPGRPTLRSLVATSWGFVAGGESISKTPTRAEVWTSTNGTSWHAKVLGTVKGAPMLASHGSIVVADDAQPVPNRLWRSSNGTTWKAAKVVGRLVSPSYSPDTMVSSSFGFVALGHSSARLWYSETGRRWVPLRNVDAPADVTVSGLYPVAGGVLAIVYHGNQPSELWQVTIAVPKQGGEG